MSLSLLLLSPSLLSLTLLFLFSHSCLSSCLSSLSSLLFFSVSPIYLSLFLFSLLTLPCLSSLTLHYLSSLAFLLPYLSLWSLCFLFSPSIMSHSPLSVLSSHFFPITFSSLFLFSLFPISLLPISLLSPLTLLYRSLVYLFPLILPLLFLLSLFSLTPPFLTASLFIAIYQLSDKQACVILATFYLTRSQHHQQQQGCSLWMSCMIDR